MSQKDQQINRFCFVFFTLSPLDFELLPLGRSNNSRHDANVYCCVQTTKYQPDNSLPDTRKTEWIKIAVVVVHYSEQQVMLYLGWTEKRMRTNSTKERFDGLCLSFCNCQSEVENFGKLGIIKIPISCILIAIELYHAEQTLVYEMSPDLLLRLHFPFLITKPHNERWLSDHPTATQPNTASSPQKNDLIASHISGLYGWKCHNLSSQKL